MKTIVTILTMMTCLLLGVTIMGADQDLRFPEVEGKALNGEEFRVPLDFAKPHNLVLAAFLREQQADVDTWIPRLEGLEESDSAFTFYEFPILPEMNAVARWWIYQGMRSGIRSETARARTVTFHIDKADFKNRLAIASEDTIQIFLADREGKIVWRTSGPWSREKEDSLRQRLAGDGRGAPGTDR